MDLREKLCIVKDLCGLVSFGITIFKSGWLKVNILTLNFKGNSIDFLDFRMKKIYLLLILPHRFYFV